jgi:hypothetical protein
MQEDMESSPLAGAHLCLLQIDKHAPLDRGMGILPMPGVWPFSTPLRGLEAKISYFQPSEARRPAILQGGPLPKGL